MVVRLDESAARATTELRRWDTVEQALAQIPASGCRRRTRQPDGPHLRADEFAEGKTGDGGRRRLAFDIVEAGRHEPLTELAPPGETTVRSIIFLVQASDPS